jgi:hypothetical protein
MMNKMTMWKVFKFLLWMVVLGDIASLSKEVTALQDELSAFKARAALQLDLDYEISLLNHRAEVTGNRIDVLERNQRN